MASNAPNELLFKLVSPEDIEAAIEIEREGYPADEAGSLESFRFRQANAGDLFLGAYLPSTNDSSQPQLIGYVCSTLSPEEKLTHASMSNHVPGSESVRIHSVCVAKSYRRKGIALQLLKEYIHRLSNTQGLPYKRVLLIAHEELRPLYEKAGFTWVGKSDVTHGSRPWYEMRLDLEDKNSAPNIPADILQSLLQPSSEKHNPTLVSDCHHGLDDLIMKDGDKEGTAVNKYDLLCPRGCRSIILKKGVAQWTERTSVMMEPEGSRHSLLPALPPPPETAQWWLVTPSPTTFENIGFSRPAGSLSTGIPKLVHGELVWLTTKPGKPLKFLICAECDLGPLGWCEVGGSEFWLATSRVGYRK